MFRFSSEVPLKWSVWLIVILFICLPISVSAALPAYMAATGETQGTIEGSVTEAGREGLIEVIEFGHSISQAIDSASGVPTGKGQHRPIRITKPIDKSSPILMTVMNDGEKLTNVTIQFWRPSRSGKEEQFYTVELLNAFIANISQSNRVHPTDDWSSTLSVPANETITLSYEKIVWTWEDGGITSEDDWFQPNP